MKNKAKQGISFGTFAQRFKDKSNDYQKIETPKYLVQASEALELLVELESTAKKCLKREPEKLNKVLEHVNYLKNVFKPYDSKRKEIENAEKQRQLRNEAICAEKGHVGEWIESSYTRDELRGDVGSAVMVPHTHIFWTRTCTRCGKTFETEEKPEEIIKKEKLAKIKEYKEKIKEIEKDL